MNGNNQTTSEEQNEQTSEVGDTIEIDGKEYNVRCELDPTDAILNKDVAEAYSVRHEHYTHPVMYVVCKDGSAGREMYLMDSDGVEEYASRARTNDLRQEFDKVADIRIGPKPARNIGDNWPQVQVYERSEEDEWYFVDFDAPLQHRYYTVEKDRIEFIVDECLADLIRDEITRQKYEGYTFGEFIRVKKDDVGAADYLLDYE